MSILKFWDQFKSFSIHFSKPHKRSKVNRYLFPILLIVIIFPLKLLLHNYAIEGAPYLLLTFIVILSAWYGGLGPGIFATVAAGLLSNFLFIEPHFSFGIASILTTIIFFSQGLIISMISEAKRHADLQKDEFISFASHELKNPLAVVKGYIDLLRKKANGKNKGKQLEYLSITDAYINKVTNLVNELLDVTKIESGKLSLHKERIDISDLLKEIVRDQQMLTETHKIKLEGKTNRKIYGDRTRINQVITNMITNSIKYSPGKKKVIVSVTNSGNTLFVKVTDFGIGLSGGVQSKIFERFYRVSNSNIQGLGLGLYISQQIANLHKGKIWVESEVGKETTFCLQIPAE